MNCSRQQQGDHKGCLDPNRAPCGQSRHLSRLNRKQRERRERVTPYFAGEVQKPKVRILCLRRRKRLSRSQWQGRSSLQKPLNSVPHLEVN